jgi:hypothetical protein
MPITWRFESNGDYVVFSVSDPYTMDEWRDAMTAILDAPLVRTEIAMLIDRRDTAPLTTSAVEEMIRFFSELQSELAGGRAAILVNSDANFGMARMTQLRLEPRLREVSIRGFRSHEEAVAWLIQQR